MWERRTAYLLEHFKFFRDTFSIIQIIGLCSIIFYIHVLGISTALEPVGFVFNNPLNASYIVTDIVFIFVWAYVFDWVIVMVFVFLDEIFNYLKHKWKGEEAPILVDYSTSFEYSYQRWRSRVLLTLIFYSSVATLLAITAIVGVYLISFFEKPLRNFLVPGDRYRGLSDDSYDRLGVYLQRCLLAAYMSVTCLVSYLLGDLRVQHLKLDQPDVIVTTEQQEVSGRVIYSLSDVFVVYDTTNELFVVLPRNNTIIRQPVAQSDDLEEGLPENR